MRSTYLFLFRFLSDDLLQQKAEIEQKAAQQQQELQKAQQQAKSVSCAP